MENQRLYVGNLSYSVTEEQLENLFSEHGTVKQVNVIEGKGFGFVEMSSPAEAEKAQEGLNQKEFMGRMLRIDEANPPPSNARRSPPRRAPEPEVLPEEDWADLSPEETQTKLLELVRKSSLKENGFGSRRFYFVTRENKIPFLDISDDLTSRLERGMAAIVEVPGQEAEEFTVVPRAVAQRMKTIDPDAVLFFNPEQSYEPARRRPPRR